MKYPAEALNKNINNLLQNSIKLQNYYNDLMKYQEMENNSSFNLEGSFILIKPEKLKNLKFNPLPKEILQQFSKKNENVKEIKNENKKKIEIVKNDEKKDDKVYRFQTEKVYVTIKTKTILQQNNEKNIKIGSKIETIIQSFQNEIFVYEKPDIEKLAIALAQLKHVFFYFFNNSRLEMF
jgi:hypothetical protein